MDHEVLAALPGLRLQLIRLEYADEDADGLSCFIRAAGEGKASEVERLLRLPLRPDCSQAEDGATALIAASEHGHLEVAQLLCDAGADKDKVMQDGATALIMASENGHLEVARMLCDAGADKDLRAQWITAGWARDQVEQDGATALMVASDNGFLEVARMLCNAGADKDKAMPDGGTALILAATKGHLKVVRMLCDAGADKDKVTITGYSMHNVPTANKRA